MNVSIKDYLKIKGIEGDIILYRDNSHKKEKMCEYLAKNISTDKTIAFYSGGAFGLYMAKAFPNNQIKHCGKVSSEYKEQIDKLTNIEIVPCRDNAAARTLAEQNDWFFIDQFNEPLIKEYYKQHLADILEELGNKHIDAFVDCGHSCATIAGFIESGLVDWKFVLGTASRDGRKRCHYLDAYREQVGQMWTGYFNTKEIEEHNESLGNIFEATRSISAAMKWLEMNPNKTVLVYVGDKY